MLLSPRAVGAGAFVVLGAVLFAVTLFLIGERRMLFADRFTIYTEFATVGQLEAGSIVRVAGANAGEVTGIIFPDTPSRKFRVRMEVREDLRSLLRADSVASIQTESLVGGVFVNIATGTEEAPVVAEGGTIPGHEPFAFADLLEQASDTMGLMQQTVQTLSGDAERTLQQIAEATADASRLFEAITPQLEAITANGARMSADAQQIVARINAGEGTLGKLITDDQLYERARVVAEEAHVVLANMREATDEARRAIADVRAKDGPAQGLVADLRATLGQAREATADLADNMEALKHNFFLRGFFNRRGYFDLDAISPARYRSGVLENGKRKAMRIWLSSAVLFAAGSNGTETLTADGRARIDSAVVTFLEHVPSNPIVVEGYATEGTAGEHYRRSRERAALVREYLLGRYGLMPQHTGFIALGADAVGSPGGKHWDGVALTLFLEAEALRFGNQ
jgi:phospholipid/cholesterol/gamma-HCH transport system substrate-binding protein